MDVENIEQYAADLFNIKEALKTVFKETGNPKLPRIVEMAQDIVRRIEDLEWEIAKLKTEILVF